MGLDGGSVRSPLLRPTDRRGGVWIYMVCARGVSVCAWAWLSLVLSVYMAGALAQVLARGRRACTASAAGSEALLRGAE